MKEHVFRYTHVFWAYKRWSGDQILWQEKKAFGSYKRACEYAKAHKEEGFWWDIVEFFNPDFDNN